MRKNALAHHGKRAAARLQAIRRRAAAWKHRARQALALTLITAGATGVPSIADAQMGQMGMAPAGGVVNRAVNGFKELNANGPGWLYYGINAADRGLGYQGSYMTLGGFIPYSQDDLGGLWAADLRAHLSVYGGFFSNVGLVRKQFLGGSLLGIGVYWDYDGDLNQGWSGTDAACTAASPFGQFGHVYNQVGVSGEWLTDFGNLRSNGYMPVGTTAYVAGAPSSPFYQNFVMCQYGLDTALSGADLEVGAYIPGLSDWAGMISVGGYALGNARYDWSNGAQTGQDVVPWFGGVYTRLDMTLLENWDFSLQANNDSYFDWTGFARLTYRMGGSRRRNVPDQMEQPMMRNEHIVRAHQTPQVAINPATGTPWRVIHVNNSSSHNGNGTAESPYTTIIDGNVAATNPYDIVLVNRGFSSVAADGTTSNAYAGTFSPLAANQYFIGDGMAFFVPTDCCGPVNIATASNGVPVLSTPTGSSINLTNGLITNNFLIQNSAVGISGSGNLSRADRGSYASNIDIGGVGPGPRTGIAVTDATGQATFRDVNISGMTNGSFVVNGGSPDLDFAVGTIANTENHMLSVNDTLGGTVSLTADPGKPFTDTGDGISVQGAAGDVVVQSNVPGNTAAVISSAKNGIYVANSTGNQTFNDIQINASGTAGGGGYAGVNLQNNPGTTNLNNLAINLTDAANTATGFLAVNDNVVNVTGNSSVAAANAAAVSMTNVADANVTFSNVTSSDSPTNGVLLDTGAGDFKVTNAITVTNSQGDGMVVKNSPSLVVTSPVTTVISAAGDGIVLQNNAVDATKVSLGQVNVATTAGTGLVAQNAGVTTAGGAITAAGGASIAANNADVNITLATASSTDSLGPGLDLTETSGTVKIATTTVTAPVGNGINAVDNVPGFKADFGVTKVSGIINGAIGVNISNAAEPIPPTSYSFDSLDITTLNGTGLLTKNGGTVNFNSPATITANGGAAIDLENTQGTTGGVAGSGFTFLDLTSTDSNGNGVRLNNLNSDLRVTGVTSIVGAAGPSLAITDTVTPPATDSIIFNTVDITRRENLGVLVDGIFGQVQVGSLNIDNANLVAGNAVQISNTTNPADPTGIDSGRVYVNGGTIDGAIANGVQVQNALASLSGVTIANSGGQGVLGLAAAGEQTTLAVNGSVLSAGAGLDGVRLEATGGGIVNATVATTLINATANSLTAVVFDPTSVIRLDATGNFGAAGTPPGTGGFVLNNQGGTLQIDQASTADLSAQNNGVSVSVPASPITFGGTTPPVPPPN
jgi:hypothetical protein